MDSVRRHLCVTLGKVLQTDGVGSTTLKHDAQKCIKENLIFVLDRATTTAQNIFFLFS